jgi:hypothetical protein
MKFYKLSFEDFKRVFEFATNYYLDPNKNTTGRTTFEPRGLGTVIDSFTLGKLTEIGVEKILFHHNSNKKYILDFEIKENNLVKNEPDINKIFENNLYREPNLFIEIKNTSDKDRWIGLTEEQFNTIKRSSKDKKIYLIYATVKSNIINSNPKAADLSGMFLKTIEDTNKSIIFQNFADLNAECKIEFIIDSEELLQFGYPFEKGMNMYETNLFAPKKKKDVYSKSGLRKDVVNKTEYQNVNQEIELTLSSGAKTENRQISAFEIQGSFILYYKKKTIIIECLTDVFIQSNIFGKFNLIKDHYYDFNHKTIGRDPKLKRNNIFISKKRVFELIENNQIKNPQYIIEKISQEI